MFFDQQAPVDWCAIPEDQYFPGKMALKMAQKLDDLEALDAAGMNLEIEPPERQTPDDGKTFPVKGLMQHRGFSAWSPSAGARGAGAQPAFVNKDDGSPLLPGLFLMPATPSAASGGFSVRRAPPPGVRDVGN